MRDLASALREDNELADLADAMPRIVDYVERRWEVPYLPWFTDHSHRHSKRVADYAERLADTERLGNVQLSSLERFILWSSAWLHDVGMQSLLNQQLGAIDGEGFSSIRHQHPSESAKLIGAERDLIGLPRDNAIIGMIARVARAHGTSFYAQEVRTLQGNSRVRNRNVRGSLLAALLLMADELDLHYQRSVQLPGDPALNTVSEAHAFKHECVASVEIDHSPTTGDIRIALTMTDTPSRSDESLILVEKWILDKLRKQTALTEAELGAGFQGLVAISRAIVVKRVFDEFSTDGDPSPEALALIRADVARDDVLDHEAQFRDAKSAIDNRGLIFISGNLSVAPLHDIDGREPIFEAVYCWAAARSDVTAAKSSVLLASSAIATCEDVLKTLLSALSQTVTEPSTREALLKSLVDAVATDSRQVVLFISSIELLPAADQRWLLSRAVPGLRDGGDVSVVLSCSPDLESNGVAGDAVWVQTGALDAKDVESHLARFAPFVTAQSEAATDLPYAGFMQLRGSHQRRLAREALRESR